jgi:hypothetical protein
MGTWARALGVSVLGGLLFACAAGSPVGDGGAGAGGADGPYSATNADGSCISNAFMHDVGGHRVCLCQMETPTSCPGTCSDLQIDDDNCGACGQVCPATATCVAGSCTATPTTAVAAAPGCGALWLYAANGVLAWADMGAGTILQGPTTGPTIPPTVVASGESAPTGVCLRGAKTFWLATVDLAAPPPDAGVPPDGGAGYGLSTTTIRVAENGAVTSVYALTAVKPSPDATGEDAIHGFTVSDDGGTVYFSTGRKIQKVAVGGGVPTDVAMMDFRGFPNALALAGDLMAFTIGEIGAVDVVRIGDVVAHCWHDDPLTAIPLDVNCDRIGVYARSVLLDRVVVSDGLVVWADGDRIDDNALSVTQTNGKMELAESFDGPIKDLAVSGGIVYFTVADPSAPGAGHIEKVAAASTDGVATSLARGLNGPDSIAVDGKKVFWSNADCEIQTTSTKE